MVARTRLTQCYVIHTLPVLFVSCSHVVVFLACHMLSCARESLWNGCISGFSPSAVLLTLHLE